MEQNVAKRVPYGIQDFVQVIEQNCYYVDKTAYIPKLEDCPNNLFCIRPRRFMTAAPRTSSKSGLVTCGLASILPPYKAGIK